MGEWGKSGVFNVRNLFWLNGSNCYGAGSKILKMYTEEGELVDEVWIEDCGIMDELSLALDGNDEAVFLKNLSFLSWKANKNLF